VSFVFELNVDALTEAQGRAIEARTRDAWPVAFKPRHRVALFWEWGPELWIRDGGDLLTDEAEPEAPYWDMNAAELPALAATLRVLGDELPQGFGFRATWTGSEVREERVLGADELAEIALASRLNEFTLYRVPAV
jgi:hypothetical protein